MAPKYDISKSARKILRKKTKDELVDMVLQMSDYAEKQKAANMILMNAMESLRQKRAAELEAASKEQNETPSV